MNLECHSWEKLLSHEFCLYVASSYLLIGYFIKTLYIVHGGYYNAWLGLGIRIMLVFIIWHSVKDRGMSYCAVHQSLLLALPSEITPEGTSELYVVPRIKQDQSIGSLVPYLLFYLSSPQKWLGKCSSFLIFPKL